ncbi:hydrophobin, mutated [Phlebiopsis gigantea 11061_1 CR5-6]|uniref:Hydrophobin n=1 Tax=Phlebiopsis gigantea (strain 11061_1 CR5-6) TaxID=745531 RepID=A0A0C3SDI0_PHLG1|nr:hydrophobin, mutated [Phlebiopsis gigantea 11061_1 CR5-6]
MFSRLTVLSVLTLTLFAAATPTARGGSGTPTDACCSSTTPANSAEGAAALKSISVVLSDLNVLVGLTCSPITVVGVASGSTCSGTTVSCTNGVVDGIGIGCVPIIL